MSGVDFVSNNGLARAAEWANGDATQFRALLLQATGLEADSILREYETVADLLASTNTEATFTNYGRQTLQNVVRTVNDTDDRVELAADTITWASAGGALNNTLGKLIIAYGPIISVDAGLIILSGHSFDATTDGNDLIAQITDFFRAASVA